MKLKIPKVLSHYFKALFLFTVLLFISEIIIRSYSRPTVSFDINWKVSRDELNSYSILKNQPWNLTFDGHMHSRFSDGYMTPIQLIEYQIANGYDVIFPTEHNNLFGALEIKSIAEQYNKDHNTNLLVIPGIEYTCCRIHMNLIGVDSDLNLLPTSNFPSDQDLQNVIAAVHKQNGIVIVNHLTWSLQQQGDRLAPVLKRHPSPDQLLQWGVDGFEVINQNVFNYPLYQFCIEHNLIIWSGSDTHYPGHPFAWNVVQAQKTQKDVMEAIKQRQSTIITHPYPEHFYAMSINDKYTFMAPIAFINGIFKSFYVLDGGMYSFVDGSCHDTIFELNFVVILSYLIWLFIGTLIFFWVDFLYIWNKLVWASTKIYNLVFKQREEASEHLDNDEGEEERGLLGK